MKMKISTAILLALIVNTANSQITKKVLELPDFKAIYVNSNYSVYLKQTNKQEVTVEANTDIFTASEFKVENGILMINLEKKADNASKSIWAKIDDIKLSPNMKVYISVKDINEIQVNANGKVISENSISSNDLTLGVNGSGSMDLDIKGNAVKAEVTGSGTLALRGYATSLDLFVSGPGNLSAFNFPLEDAKVKVSGAGTCELNVTNSLTAVVMGNGIIKHKGSTKTTSKKVFGAGAVERAY
jgi:hypothetical protein